MGIFDVGGAIGRRVELRIALMRCRRCAHEWTVKTGLSWVIYSKRVCPKCGTDNGKEVRKL